MTYLRKHKDAGVKPVEQSLELVMSSENGGMSTEEVKRFSIFRNQVLFATMFGYATFYLIRLNFSAAIPTLQLQLNYSKTQLGVVTTTFAVVYGIGKFLNGYFGDRSNARYFMTIGLVGSALINLVMGLGESIAFFCVCWAINGWFQSMGWPPVARSLTHWFSPQELATKWAIWNCSQPIGGALNFALAGSLVVYVGWQAAFYVPAIVSLFAAIVLFKLMRDTPQSMGLQPVEVYANLVHKDDLQEEEHVPTREILMRVFGNKTVWYVCLANMFLYVVRMGAFTWAPSFLQEMKGSSQMGSMWQTIGFEVAGMCGGLIAGWASDKIFEGRRGPVSFIFMAALAITLLAFWQLPAGYGYLDSVGMFLLGFLVYGPQVLVGVAAADLASKKAAGMATGLTGTFGYIGAAVSGVGIGYIVDVWGWDGGFVFFIACALMGLFFFALTWTKRAKILES